MVQYFFLTIKQHQPVYQPQKPLTEQLEASSGSISLLRSHMPEEGGLEDSDGKESLSHRREEEECML